MSDKPELSQCHLSTEDGLKVRRISADEFRIPINFIKLHPDVLTPTKGSAGAACFDIAAYLDAPVSIRPFQTALIPTGLSFRLPPNSEIQVRPRSGLPNKHRVFVANAPGTVDSDYHGELMVGLYNGNPDAVFVVHDGERIAQFLVAPVPDIRLNEIPYEEPSSERGENGFGSTGR